MPQIKGLYKDASYDKLRQHLNQSKVILMRHAASESNRLTHELSEEASKNDCGLPLSRWLTVYAN